jgi:F0F1-type ATP synthase membrane subunit c/vacuolar-type H+-ATPase subunit K
MDSMDNKSHAVLPTFSTESPRRSKGAVEAYIARNSTAQNVLTKCLITVIILIIYTCLHGAGLATITLQARRSWLTGEESLTLGRFVGSLIRLVSAYLMVGIAAYAAAPVVVRVASGKGLARTPEDKQELTVVLSLFGFVAISLVPADHWWFISVLWFAMALWTAFVVGSYSLHGTRT